MDERYDRNIGALTEDEQKQLKAKRIAVVGCGGLGGYVSELLTRIGIGHLTLIDGDIFTASNLNRQLFSLEDNLGKKKAIAAREKLLQINSDLSIETFDVFLDDENAESMLKDHHVIIDALDNSKTRLIIEKAANTLAIPLVHGAVEQWCAQVSTVYPGENTLSLLYHRNTPSDSINHKVERPSVLSFVPAFCASIEVSEAIKILLKKEHNLRKKLLTVDLKANSFEVIDLSAKAHH